MSGYDCRNNRAGFSLSRALFRKMWGPSLIPPFSFLPKMTTFLLITVNFIDFTARLNSHDTHTDSVVSITPKQKFPGPLVGPFLCGPLFGRTCWTCLNPPLRNKCVFSFWRNVASDGADWTSVGRLFQSRGPAAAATYISFHFGFYTATNAR